VSDDTLKQLLENASELDTGEARIAQLREIARRAEAGGHTALLVEARVRLLRSLYDRNYANNAATAQDLRDLAVAYSRCQTLYTRAPEFFSEEDSKTLREKTINVTLRLLRAAAYPTGTLRTYLDEMEEYWPVSHHYLYGSAALRMELEGLSGNFSAAQAAMDRLHTLDPGDDWDQSTIYGCWAKHLSDHERDEEAIAALEPILAGEVPRSDDRPPHYHWRLLLIPYLRTGRHERARDLYRCHQDKKALGVAKELEFLARSGNEDLAAKIIRNGNYRVTRHGPLLYEGLWVDSAVALACRRLIELERGGETFEVTLRDETDPRTVTAVELHRASTDSALACARQADACHGNTYQSDRVHAIINAEPLVDRLPLDDTGSGGTATESQAQP
jgi:cellulose synthase operon protein C